MIGHPCISPTTNIDSANSIGEQNSSSKEFRTSTITTTKSWTIFPVLQPLFNLGIYNINLWGKATATSPCGTSTDRQPRIDRTIVCVKLNTHTFITDSPAQLARRLRKRTSESVYCFWFLPFGPNSQCARPTHSGNVVCIMRMFSVVMATIRFERD